MKTNNYKREKILVGSSFTLVLGNSIISKIKNLISSKKHQLKIVAENEDVNLFI